MQKNNKNLIHLQQIILEATQTEKLTEETIHNIKKQVCKKYKIKDLPTNIQLFQVYKKLVEDKKIKPNKQLENIIKKRKIRSLSGIVPIQVLTKPWPCPGQCIFCPNEAIMPKSYISSEPWAMRALLNDFDPIKQVYNRLLSLQLTWHNTDKIEMIVLGWSFDAYPLDYKIDFIKKLYDACNTFDQFQKNVKVDISNPKSSRFITKQINIKYSKTLEQAQLINETASNRIIWLTIETRPDLVNEENVRFRRQLWVTRIEIWVQSLFDDVLQANKRWHTVKDIQKAFHTMRKYWLKISAHIMFWLYGSDEQKDIETFIKLFKDPYLKPDELKIYPTSVIANTQLYNLYKEWKYKPISNENIEKLIIYIKEKIIPPFTRIKRFIRDIPATEIVAWSNITNLRQIVWQKLKQKLKHNEKLQQKYFNRLYNNLKVVENLKEIVDHKPQKDFTTFLLVDEKLFLNNKLYCLCTRCREIRNTSKANNVILVIRKYLSSVWEEYFISFETNNWYLYWFCRLLLPKQENIVDIDWLWEKTGIIRELHVYWKQEKIWQKWDTQHRWFWKKLMDIAEKICITSWYESLSVISWIWVKQYYAKLWYKKQWTYMKKTL